MKNPLDYITSKLEQDVNIAAIEKEEETKEVGEESTGEEEDVLDGQGKSEAYLAMIRENDEDSSSDFLKDEGDEDDEKLNSRLVDDIQAYQIDDDSVKELSEIKEEKDVDSQQSSQLQVAAESQESKSKLPEESQSPKLKKEL